MFFLHVVDAILHQFTIEAGAKQSVDIEISSVEYFLQTAGNTACF